MILCWAMYGLFVLQWEIFVAWNCWLASSIDEYFMRLLFWRSFSRSLSIYLMNSFYFFLKHTGRTMGSRVEVDYPEGRSRHSRDVLTNFLSIFSSIKVTRFSAKTPWFSPSLWRYPKLPQTHPFVFLKILYDQGWSCVSPENFCGMIAQELAEISTFQKMRPIWGLSTKSTSKIPLIAERNTSSNQPFNTNQRHNAPWWE